MAADSAASSAELAVERDQQFAGAVLPVKQDGRALAAPGGMARGQRLLHAFGMDFIAGNGQAGPGFQSQLRKFGGRSFFYQLIAVGRRRGIEP